MECLGFSPSTVDVCILRMSNENWVKLDSVVSLLLVLAKFKAISGMQVQQSHPWLLYRPVGSASYTLSEVNNCSCKYCCGFFRRQSIPFSSCCAQSWCLFFLGQH